MELKKNSDVESKRRCFNQTSLVFSCSEEDEHMLMRDVAAELNCSGPGQACSVNVSESKSSEESLPYLSSSLDAAIEMYNKKRSCHARVNESKREAAVLGGACDDTHGNCGVCEDCRQSHPGEESQLEYFSVHEQDFDDGDSSSEFSEPKETTEVEMLNLLDAVHEAPGCGVVKEHDLVDMSVECSPVSEYGAGDQTCPEAAKPELPHLLQDTLSLPDCNGMPCDHQEEQTEYHSVVWGSIPESCSCGSKGRVCPDLLVCDSLGSREVKDVLLADGTPKPQTATGQEVPGNSDRHVCSISVKQENPLLSPAGSAPAVTVQFCDGAEDSDFYSYEGSGACAHGASCTAKDAATQFPVSAVLTRENPFSEGEVADKPSHGNTSCLNLEHHGSLRAITGGAAVNQAVDAGSDFRASFTTSRSTSAQVCLSSRAVNTEITMMDKSGAVGWCHETCAGVAGIPGGSCGAGVAEKMWSQLSDTPEKHSGGNSAAAKGRSQLLEQQESENELCSSDLETSTGRLLHPDKQAGKNSTSNYCQKTLQRAVEAELQILNTHYRMCYQHCLKICKLTLEENTSFSRSNGNTELNFYLILVLEELNKKYNRMKEKLKMGVPLNSLPPLSVEMKLFQVSLSYVPSKDSPQAVCVTDGGQPSDSTSSRTFEEQHQDEDVECGCVENEEGDECWFDVGEELTVAAFPGISEETKKQQEKQDTADLREMESGNARSSICVDGLSSPVSQGDLRLHFQKYQVSDTITSVDSSNYRYTLLPFEDSNKAKLAVEEMNQKKIKGKPGTGESLPQKTSAPLSSHSSDAFIPRKVLNLSNFTKLMKKLQELHPEASRDRIVDALLEVRKNNNGVLRGLSISSILERTSVVLKKSTPSDGWEKQCKNNDAIEVISVQH
ncbi:RNA-binding protein 44 [Aegotheles albertisi]